MYMIELDRAKLESYEFSDKTYVPTKGMYFAGKKKKSQKDLSKVFSV